jgi:hypothetical protein
MSAYHPDGPLVCLACAERDQLHPRLSKALAREAWERQRA